jgi:hypothetical protein
MKNKQNDSQDKKGVPFKVFAFNEAYEPPVSKWDKKLNILTWGKKNKYPNYIIDMYNDAGSTTHKSIINKKVRLCTGKGFVETDDERLNQFIADNELSTHIKRASLDLELFNGFAFEVIWSNDGSRITNIQHLPLHKVRIGVDDSGQMDEHVWFSNDWDQTKKEEYKPEYIPMYNTKKPRGKQIYLYTEYNPNSEFYPIASYSTGMNYIELDYEISKFHLNQVKQGYSPSFILNFATGIPTEEEQDTFFRDFKRNYSGTDNSGKIILTYSEGQEQAPEIQTINLNDSDERFTLLQDMVEKNIVMAHEIPAAMSILTPGKLGSTNERKELLEEFNQSYIVPRQETLEHVINLLIKPNQYTEELELATYIDKEAPVSNDKEGDARSQLRGSVGGVQGIIQIQQSVAEGLTDRSSAAALLELIYGFDPTDALRLLGSVQEGEQKDNEEENNTEE